MDHVLLADQLQAMVWQVTPSKDSVSSIWNSGSMEELLSSELHHVPKTSQSYNQRGILYMVH